MKPEMLPLPGLEDQPKPEMPALPYKERLPTTGSVGDGWCCMGDSLLNGEDVHGPDAAEAGDDSPRRYWLMP
jgi:hypothetical protein